MLIPTTGPNTVDIWSSDVLSGWRVDGCARYSGPGEDGIVTCGEQGDACSVTVWLADVADGEPRLVTFTRDECDGQPLVTYSPQFGLFRVLKYDTADW